MGSFAQNSYAMLRRDFQNLPTQFRNSQFQTFGINPPSVKGVPAAPAAATATDISDIIAKYGNGFGTLLTPNSRGNTFLTGSQAALAPPQTSTRSILG